MLPLTITKDLGTTPWQDLAHVISAGGGYLERIGRLPKGMQSGKSSVALYFRMQDGSEHIAQTSLALLLNAAKALEIADSMDAEPTPVPEAPPPPQPESRPNLSPTTSSGVTTDPFDLSLGIKKPNGQNERYLILSEEERAKGFVRPLRTSYIHNNCGVETRMSHSIAETYAREPTFYSHTFCVGCKAHHPVNQFTWKGTTELVGS